MHVNGYECVDWDQFIQHVGFQVGNGCRVRLWHDRRCGNTPLKEVFPVLIECAANQEATIDSVLIHQRGGVEWNMTFVHNFNDHELNGVTDFLHHLYSHTPVSLDNDVFWWRLKKNGLFDIRSFYDAIRDCARVNFPWKSVWHSKAPRRVCFSIWSAAWHRILTCDNLMRWGYTMTSGRWKCRCGGESLDHLLIHCSMASILWNFAFCSFGIQWVLPKRVVDLLRGWWNIIGRHFSGIWNIVHLCLMWTLWRERNHLTFEDKQKKERAAGWLCYFLI